MTTKHTPGPGMATPRGYVIFADRSADIANVTSANGDEVMMANANLIAAAPDLLVALEGMVKTFGNSTVLSDYGREQVKVAKAAISKAKGE